MSPHKDPPQVCARADADKPDQPRADGAELTLAMAPHIAPLLAVRTEGLGERTPADLSFSNLWLFREAHRWRWHGGAWPCLSGFAYDGRPIAVPLFDVRRAPIDELRFLVARHGSLYALSEREATSISDPRLMLAACRDDADYVYPAHQFRFYRGRALRKKANLMAQLQVAHVLHAKPYGPRLRQDALAVLQGWMQDKHKARGDADEAACRDALSNAAELRLDGFVHWADGQPAGFLLAEEVADGVWVIRFAKGRVRFKGIAQYMFHHFACRPSAKVDWINFEQDLGLPGFRQTKLSYRPALLLPKWRLLASTES